MGYIRSFFNKVSEYQKQKKIERDLQCHALTEEASFANQEIAGLIADADRYIYEYSYRQDDVKWRELGRRLTNISHSLRKSSCYQEFQEEVEKLHNALAAITSDIAVHNQLFLDRQIEMARQSIGSVEGKILDCQQMACIVKDAPNHLVLAGAGTGKTTTIVGKVKYLLANQACQPEEILVLSFTKATAEEMSLRLKQEKCWYVEAETFHKLGINIMSAVEKKMPAVYNSGGRDFIRDQIESCIKEPAYLRSFIQYLLFHRVNEKSEFDFDSEKSYRKYLEVNPPATVKGEKVKSYGEMEIANFLAKYSVKYEYEASYPVDTRTEKYGQYHPDFFLPDYNIYIEYYGINRQGEVPSYFSGRDGKSASEVYREGIAWKKKLHKANNTILIECYAYEKFDGVLRDKLYRELQRYGVKLKEITTDQLFAEMDMEVKSVTKGLAEIFKTLLNLAKGNRFTADELSSMCASPRYMGQKVLVSLFAPVYEAYEKMLRENGYIDFNDMINRSADYITAGAYHHHYKYVIVDEYQDISKSRYNLLKAMRNDSHFSLFCVGDDWQSIYRFNGSDIGYILDFSKYWGDSEISRIETTYRFSKSLINISSRFIMNNPNQLKKMIQASVDTDWEVLEVIQGKNESHAIHLMVSSLKKLPSNSSVLLIGRYQADLISIKKNRDFQKEADARLPFGQDLKIALRTAHSSKGLQADYVYIINNKASSMGFPSRIENPPLVDLLLEQADTYPDAEERRLYYVAMTRARKKVFLVTSERNVSYFVRELQNYYREERLKYGNCGR